MNYNGRKFKVISKSENSEVAGDTIFEYKQIGDVLTASYSGGEVKIGHLLGVVDSKGTINLRYHQINAKNELMTGKCISIPERLSNGKIRLHENWEWTSGDFSKGTSVIEEI